MYEQESTPPSHRDNAVPPAPGKKKKPKNKVLDNHGATVLHTQNPPPDADATKKKRKKKREVTDDVPIHHAAIDEHMGLPEDDAPGYPTELVGGGEQEKRKKKKKREKRVEEAYLEEDDFEAHMQAALAEVEQPSGAGVAQGERERKKKDTTKAEGEVREKKKKKKRSADQQPQQPLVEEEQHPPPYTPPQQVQPQQPQQRVKVEGEEPSVAVKPKREKKERKKRDSQEFQQQQVEPPTKPELLTVHKEQPQYPVDQQRNSSEDGGEGGGENVVKKKMKKKKLKRNKDRKTSSAEDAPAITKLPQAPSPHQIAEMLASMEEDESFQRVMLANEEIQEWGNISLDVGEFQDAVEEFLHNVEMLHQQQEKERAAIELEQGNKWDYAVLGPCKLLDVVHLEREQRTLVEVNEESSLAVLQLESEENVQRLCVDYEHLNEYAEIHRDMDALRTFSSKQAEQRLDKQQEESTGRSVIDEEYATCHTQLLEICQKEYSDISRMLHDRECALNRDNMVQEETTARADIQEAEDKEQLEYWSECEQHWLSSQQTMYQRLTAELYEEETHDRNNLQESESSHLSTELSEPEKEARYTILHKEWLEGQAAERLEVDESYSCERTLIVLEEHQAYLGLGKQHERETHCLQRELFCRDEDIIRMNYFREEDMETTHLLQRLTIQWNELKNRCPIQTDESSAFGKMQEIEHQNRLIVYCVERQREEDNETIARHEINQEEETDFQRMCQEAWDHRQAQYEAARARIQKEEDDVREFINALYDDFCTVMQEEEHTARDHIGTYLKRCQQLYVHSLSQLHPSPKMGKVCHHSCCIHEKKAYIVGGITDGRTYNRMIVPFDTTNHTWETPIKFTHYRRNHSSVIWEDKMVIHGGIGPGGLDKHLTPVRGVVRGTDEVYNVGGGIDHNRIQALPQSASAGSEMSNDGSPLGFEVMYKPPPEQDPKTAYIYHNNQKYASISPNDGYLQDTIVYDLVAKRWEKVNTPTCSVCDFRACHTAVVVADTMLIFGGWTIKVHEETRPSATYVGDDSDEELAAATVPTLEPYKQSSYIQYNTMENRSNDLLLFDCKNLTWEKAKRSKHTPCARSGHAALLHKGLMFVIGGATTDVTHSKTNVNNTEGPTSTTIRACTRSPSGRTRRRGYRQQPQPPSWPNTSSNARQSTQHTTTPTIPGYTQSERLKNIISTMTELSVCGKAAHQNQESEPQQECSNTSYHNDTTHTSPDVSNTNNTTQLTTTTESQGTASKHCGGEIICDISSTARRTHWDQPYSHSHSHRHHINHADSHYNYPNNNDQQHQQQTQTQTKWLNDVHVYNPVTNKWDLFEARGEVPSGREGHSVVYHCNSFILLGGQQDGVLFNDIYQLALETQHWRKVSYHVCLTMRPRCGHSMCALVTKSAAQILLKQKVDGRPFVKHPAAPLPVCSVWTFGGVVKHGSHSNELTADLDHDDDYNENSYAHGSSKCEYSTGGTFIVTFRNVPENDPDFHSQVAPKSPHKVYSGRYTATRSPSKSLKLKAYSEMLTFANRFYYSVVQTRDKVKQDNEEKVAQYEVEVEGRKPTKKLTGSEADALTKRIYDHALDRHKAIHDNLEKKYFAVSKDVLKLQTEKEMQDQIDRMYTQQLEHDKKRQTELAKLNRVKSVGKRLETQDLERVTKRLYNEPLQAKRKAAEHIQNIQERDAADNPNKITSEQVAALVFRLTSGISSHPHSCRDRTASTTSRLSSGSHGGTETPLSQGIKSITHLTPTEMRDSIQTLYYRRTGIDPPANTPLIKTTNDLKDVSRSRSTSPAKRRKESNKNSKQHATDQPPGSPKPNSCEQPSTGTSAAVVVVSASAKNIGSSQAVEKKSAAGGGEHGNREEVVPESQD